MGIVACEGACEGCGEICSLQRRSQIYAILDERVPFTVGDWLTRDRREKVFWTPKDWFGRAEQFSPVAFKPSIRIMESFGGMSVSGGMYPYLWVTPSNQFISECRHKKRNRFVFVDPATFTDEDVAWLKIGVQGSLSLLDSELEKAEDAIIQRQYPEYR